MEIIDAKLEFSSNLRKRNDDFVSLISTKVVICNENKNNISINELHQFYQNKNLEGIPYHYLVKENGDVYIARNRAYENGFSMSEFNSFKNAICVLVEGLVDNKYTSMQQSSLVELLTMIVLQDNLFVTDIISQDIIKYGFDSGLSDIAKLVASKVIITDPFRTIGDNDNNKTFFKIVSNNKTNSISNIRRYTSVPENIIKNMNPHIKGIENNIYPGTTIFLPSNRMSNLLNDVTVPMMINDIYNRIIGSISDYKDELESYGKDVE